MRVRDVQRQFRYWSRFPTVRDMVASYLGVTPEAGPRSGRPQSEDEMRRAILMHGTGHG